MTVQFGLNVSTAATAGADPVAWALAAENLGYDFVSASDHPCGVDPTYETWTMLTWVAAATTRIKVATRVLGVPYRSPAMVAKMAETLDRLSGGRLILGLGGGYSDDEFRAFGLGVPSPAEKVTGLDEAVRIIRGLWAEPQFTFRGERYHTAEADLEPKPEHRIPIWLGAVGSRALRVTGRLADGWIPSLGFAPPEWIPGMRDRLRTAAREAGRDPDEVTCVYNVEVRVGRANHPSPSVVRGSPAAIADQLRRFIALGFTAFNFMPVGPDTAGQAERLAREVLPEVRPAG